MATDNKISAATYPAEDTYDVASHEADFSHLNSTNELQSKEYVNSTNAHTSNLPNQVKKWTPLLVFKLITLLLAQFLVLSGYSMISPFFPQIAKEKGLGETMTGFIFASFQATMFLMTPIYGSLIANLTPKFLCVSGVFLCGGCCISFGLLNLMEQPYFMVLSFIIRLVEGNGAAMLVVSCTSLVIDAFPQSTSTMASIIEMVAGMGFIFGPSVGSGLYELGGFTLPFLVIGGLCLAEMFILMFSIPSSIEVKKESKNFLHFLKIPGMVVLFLHCTLTSLALTYMDPILSSWSCHEFNITPTTVGLIFTGWSATYAVTSPFVGKISDKGYVYSTMIVGLVANGLIYLMLAPSPLLSFLFPDGKPIYAVMIVVCLMMGVSGSLLYIPPYQAAIDLAVINGYDTGIHTYGLIAGMISSGNCLGAFLGPLMSGYLTETYKFPWATTIMALAMIAMSFVMMTYLVAMRLAGKPLKPSDSAVDEKGDDEERQSLLADNPAVN